MNRLKIAVVHSFYRAGPSGENQVVELQVQALSRAGYTVELISQHSDDLRRAPGFALRAGWNVMSGGGFSPRRVLERFRPDVVHVHNLFPNIGMDWLEETSFPVVMSVHNFRAVCAAGTLFLDGEPCEKCPSSNNFHSVINRCYQGSSLRSLPLAISGRRGLPFRTMSACARLLYLSETAQATMERLLPDLRKIPAEVLPNFLPESQKFTEPKIIPENSFWLYAGRLSAEKGVLKLVDNWDSERTLVIAGSGPLEGVIRDLVGTKRIKVLGAIPQTKVQALMAKAIGLVFPSLWPEHGPMVVIEALRLGLPVVTFSRNSVADQIRDGNFGAVFADFNRLQDELQRVEKDREKFSKNGRLFFEKRHSESVWLDGIEGIYRSVLKE